MILLVGECGGHRVRTMQARGWGRMWVRRTITPYAGEPWGFDNGVFSDFRRGVPFDAAAFLARLARARQAGRPLLAVVPDLMQDPASLAYSLAWRARLPNDWPWYLAVQDGMTPNEVEPYLDQFAGERHVPRMTTANVRRGRTPIAGPDPYGRAPRLP